MPLVSIPITGQQYQSRSGQLSNQTCQNFYAELVQDGQAKARYVLQPTPGMKFFSKNGTNPDRGMFEHRGILYKVSGTTFSTVASTGIQSNRGTVAGTDEAIIIGMGSNIVIIANSGTVYGWDGTTFSTHSDAQFETPGSAAHLNNQMIYQGDNDRFVSSDVGDESSIDALNYATAESDADSLVRVFTFEQFLWLFGQKTLEKWWNSGNGNPPFDRVEGAIIQVGCDAKHSVAANDNAMYWLGDDKQVYRYAGGAALPISNIAMHSKVKAYATSSDAKGFTFTMEGQNFYFLTFPTQDVTWLYNEVTGWTTLSSGSAGGRSYVNSYAFAFGKHLVGDHRNGNIYEWDLTVHTDRFDPIIRIRDTAPIHGGLYGKPGVSVEQNDFKLIMEVGVGAGSAYAAMRDDATDTCSTPDSAPSSITGDIDIRAKINPESWTAGTTQGVVSKTDATTKISYQLVLEATSGLVQLFSSPDGTNSAKVNGRSTVAPSITDGSVLWIRATLDVDDGASNRVYKFYTSTDGSAWTQLGTTVTTSGTTSIHDNDSKTKVGSNTIPAVQTYAGKIHQVQIYDGISGTLAVNFDARDWASGTTWTASTTGETWTVNGGTVMSLGGASPSLSLAISDDGGSTFGTAIDSDIGSSTDLNREVKWNALGSFNDARILRIQASDEVLFSIHGASSYIELGI